MRRTNNRIWATTLSFIVGVFAANSINAQTYAALSLGSRHTCGLTARGNVECWGNGSLGRTGDPALQDAAVPRIVAELPHALHVAAGGDQTCAATSAHGVFCWGSNARGQLGTPTSTSLFSAIPLGNTTVAVGTGPFRGLVSGMRHSCVLKDTGEVYCWGDNASGQRGSDAVSSGTPQSAGSNQVVGLPAATAMAAGDAHTCAILLNGTVRCWGANSSGELGYGTTGGFTNTPQVAAGLSNVTSIAAGQRHTCAVSIGNVFCWGNGTLNQNGSSGSRNTPTQVAGIANATQVVAGRAHSCARLSSGQVMCWGNNDLGRLGDEFATLGSTALPVLVSGITDATALAAGGDSTCALNANGRARCWGENGAGQLGVNATFQSSVPKRVAAISDAAQVATGYATACVRHANGTVSCWGLNDEKQAGFAGSSFYLSSPRPVEGLSSVVSISLGQRHGCALITNGSVRCWGANDYGQLANAVPAQSATPMTVPGISTATAITSGESHSCALLSQGGIRCWGLNSSGQLGHASTVSSSSNPVDVVNLGGVATALAAGDEHTCAVVGANVRCWGKNSQRQLGNNTVVPSNLPVTVQSVAGATAVYAGRNNSCALLAQPPANQIWCWGANDLFKSFFLLSASDLDPINVTWLATRNPAQLTLGPGHSCVRADDSSATCLGSNYSGELGVGTTAASTSTNAFLYRVVGLGPMAQIAAGNGFTCARKSDGSVWCWGAGDSGQLGDGHSAQYVGSPQHVVDGKCSMDIDDNGSASAATDGLLLTRALLGFSGTQLTQSALGAGATRNTWSAIRAHLVQNCGLVIAAP